MSKECLHKVFSLHPDLKDFAKFGHLSSHSHLKLMLLSRFDQNIYNSIMPKKRWTQFKPLMWSSDNEHSFKECVFKVKINLVFSVSDDAGRFLEDLTFNLPLQWPSTFFHLLFMFIGTPTWMKGSSTRLALLLSEKHQTCLLNLGEKKKVFTIKKDVSGV